MQVASAANVTNPASVLGSPQASSGAAASDPVAQQIAQYTAILNDTSGKYSQNDQVAAFMSIGSLLNPNGAPLSTTDRQAAQNAMMNTTFGAYCQNLNVQVESNLIANSNDGGKAYSSKIPQAALDYFNGLSSSDQKLYVSLGINGSDKFGSVDSYRADLQAQVQLNDYVSSAISSEGLNPHIMASSVKDPTLAAALKLATTSANDVDFASQVAALLGPVGAGSAPQDSITLSPEAQAALTSSMPANSNSTTPATSAQFALGVLKSTQPASDASVALKVLGHASDPSKSSARASAGPASATGLASGGKTNAQKRPYTEGDLVNAKV